LSDVELRAHLDRGVVSGVDLLTSFALDALLRGAAVSSELSELGVVRSLHLDAVLCEASEFCVVLDA